MIRRVTLYCLSLFASLTLLAQPPQYYKQGGTTPITSGIFLNSASAKKIQEWYVPTDFNTLPISGNITKLYFRNETSGATGTYTNFVVSLKQPASGAGFSGTTFETGMTEVLNVPSQVLTGSATAGGWFFVTLSTPFLYDNSKPLVFEVKYDSYTGGITTWASNSGTTPNKKLYSGTTTAVTGTSHNAYWQDFGMDLVPAGPCTTPPTPGIATASVSAAVCPGTSVVLNISGNSSGSGQTYQWKSSPTQNGLYTAFGSATSGTSSIITATATQWYKAVVTCNGQSDSTPPVQVIVQTPFPGRTHPIYSSQPKRTG